MQYNSTAPNPAASKNDNKVRKTKTSTEIKNNPFEVKINRKKFDILGRKTKHDVGLPGVSRSKAINKRKETLLKESNKFIERRFGEYDTKMAPKDKILQRFAMERQVSDVVMYLYYCKQDSGLEQDTLCAYHSLMTPNVVFRSESRTFSEGETSLLITESKDMSSMLFPRAWGDFVTVTLFFNHRDGQSGR
uniref:Uncharacterized protein n=1 Tax=Lates calcarifer TaxID=8187 RepID=A0A4W6CHX0_LATCA